MSKATLNRIVREQTVFYNTKRERDAAEGWVDVKHISTQEHKPWSPKEHAMLKANIDCPIPVIMDLIARSFASIKFRKSLIQRRVIV